MKNTIIALMILFSATAFAERPWTMASGTTITIDTYDPVTKTFELTYLEFPAQGPLITTAPELAKAIKALNLERIKRNPTSILESQYTTDKELVLLLPEQVEALKPKVKPKEKKP